MSQAKQLSEVLHEWAEVFMRRSMREHKRFMDESGLSPGKIHTLMRLHFGGECGVSQIGNHLGVTNAAASQLVDRLVQLGLVDRSEDPNDRRVKQLSLTEAGQDLIQQTVVARRRWMERLTDSLSAEEQAPITIALSLLTEAARRLDDET